MTEKTLAQIHQAYIDALQISTEGATEIGENFYFFLCTIDSIDNRDQIQFDNFLNGVGRCIEERRESHTFQVTNLCTDILYTSMIIQMWLNETQGLRMDVNYSGRRKSLDSELGKLLMKAKKGEYATIHDRFGIRAVVLDNTIPSLYKLSNAILGIFTGLNRLERANFQTWVATTEILDPESKEKVIKTLLYDFYIHVDPAKNEKSFNHETFPEIDVPAKSETSYPKMVKDYIRYPKPNGYQSLHFILRLRTMIPSLNEVSIEFQFRTHKMDVHAVNGGASHKAYKEQRLLIATCSENDTENFSTTETAKQKKDKTFDIEPEVLKKLHIRGFVDCSSPENDIDGVHFGKIFVSRRLNDHSKFK